MLRLSREDREERSSRIQAVQDGFEPNRWLIDHCSGMTRQQ